MTESKHYFALLTMACIAHSAAATEHLVPRQFSTIQSAIDAANDGDTVLVAPGIYHEAIRIEGKSITLASEFIHKGDPSLVRRTILDGTLPDPDLDDDEEPMLDEVIFVGPSVGADTRIIGFTIRDGDDGIACHASIEIRHNRFVNNVDGIDYEGGGGLCEHNEFVANDDDGVDLDGSCAAVVADNLIRDNDDDGIEIRLHEYGGSKRLDIVIRNNRISGNGEDGIQIIDYPDLSNRHIRIANNVVSNNAMAGIGMMSDGNTRENFESASIPEPIDVVNNTISENQFGISGGDCVVAFNNTFVLNSVVGMNGVNGNSKVNHNGFSQNGTDAKQSRTGETLHLAADADKQPTWSDSGILELAMDNGRVVQAPKRCASNGACKMGAWLGPVGLPN